jgi:hypothetical protein
LTSTLPGKCYAQPSLITTTYDDPSEAASLSGWFSHPERFLTQPPEDHDHEQSRSRAVIGLLIVALLVIAAVYLVHALRNESKLEDCLMSGRSNCAPIEVPARNR